mmetsp:Transcript_9006/g.21942  ORF Transcript_9006/g.21942 Transcript_9006/m.21942 type:complete len:94 (+) Transcript_9006:351-632(+)
MHRGPVGSMFRSGSILHNFQKNDNNQFSVEARIPNGSLSVICRGDACEDEADDDEETIRAFCPCCLCNGVNITSVLTEYLTPPMTLLPSCKIS